MKVNGKMINSMEKAQRLGMKVLSMMENTLMERKKALGSTYGQMDQYTMESGSITESTEEESIFGRMAESTTVSGQTTIWRVTVSTSGLTADAMRASIIMIRNVVTACITGLMEDGMKAGGTRVNSTVLEPT